MAHQCVISQNTSLNPWHNLVVKWFVEKYFMNYLNDTKRIKFVSQLLMYTNEPLEKVMLLNMFYDNYA